MPIISFIDPHFDFETSIFVLGEIEELISKKDELEVSAQQWINENEHERIKNEEYYQSRIDSFSDDSFMISELERNLLSGLGITLNTAFEKHIDLISRTISKITLQ